MAEPHPTPALALVAELGLLPAICPGLEWSETVRSYLMEVEGQLAWYQLEALGSPPEPWILFLGGLALSTGDRVVSALADRLQLGGPLRDRFLSLPDAVEAITAAAGPGMALSQRAKVVKQIPAEALLLVMESENYGTFNIVNGNMGSFYDFLLKAKEIMGFRTKINSIKFETLELPAARPRYSPLTSSKFETVFTHKMRPWQDALVDLSSKLSPDS